MLPKAVDVTEAFCPGRRMTDPHDFEANKNPGFARRVAMISWRNNPESCKYSPA